MTIGKSLTIDQTAQEDQSGNQTRVNHRLTAQVEEDYLGINPTILMTVKMPLPDLTDKEMVADSNQALQTAVKM